ncbi:MAG: hypothetical protein RHS_4309 [Robinsoniella sp. RHS]|nr:MAG: hypothetical protein RHS_4309 [Robinsoniella sp. RHS]
MIRKRKTIEWKQNIKNVMCENQSADDMIQIHKEGGIKK